jgi:MFS family permease
MARSTWRERRNVAILATNQALYGAAAITAITLGGLVGQRLAPTLTLATLPIALMMIGVVAAALPASLLTQRLGRRTGFVVGTVGGGAAGAAVSVVAISVESFALFCFGGLLLGVYQAFANLYRFAAADAAGPAFRSNAIALVLAGGVAAAFIGPFNASRAVDLLPGVADAGPYAVVVGLTLLGASLHMLLRIPDEQQARSGFQRPLPVIASQPAFGVAVLAGTVGYTVMILTMTAMPLAMRQAGFGLHDSATVMQWHVLGMFAPSFVTGRLVARFGAPSMLLAGAGGLAAAIGVAAAGQTMAHFLLALVLLGVGWNFLYIGGSALLTTVHTPAERGKVQGLNEFVVFGAVAVGSLLAGALLHTVGWATLNLMLLPFVAATASATWWWRRRAETAAEAATP